MGAAWKFEAIYDAGVTVRLSEPGTSMINNVFAGSLPGPGTGLERGERGQLGQGRGVQPAVPQ